MFNFKFILSSFLIVRILFRGIFRLFDEFIKSLIFSRSLVFVFSVFSLISEKSLCSLRANKIPKITPISIINDLRIICPNFYIVKIEIKFFDPFSNLYYLTIFS